MLFIRERSWYDFSLQINVLVKSTGISGIAFRVTDNYNYYALLLNKTKGYKAIVKVISGNMTILQKVKDGGILLNDWHTVKITVKSGDISITMYDAEHSSPASTEKTLTITDNTFSSGSVGVFINGMDGFYFDDLQVTPSSCWSPWIPKKHIQIKSPNSNVYSENFKGDFNEKYDFIDIIDGRDGPGKYILNAVDKLDMAIGLIQQVPVYDSSSTKFSSIALVKRKYLHNGTFKISFVPDSPNGIISAIFKYHKQKNATGQTVKSYYSLDMINSDSESQFLLRKIIAGNSIEVMSVTEAIPGLKYIGYVVDAKHELTIECTDLKITVRLMIGTSDAVTIMEVRDGSIQSGLVGVGTFKTTVTFGSIELYPPQLELTEGDKNLIMNTDTDTIPMPSVADIMKSFRSTKRGKDKGSMDSVEAAKSVVGSSLGYNFFKKSSNPSNKDTSDKNDQDKNIANKLLGWRVCATTQTENDRNNYCSRTFSSGAKKSKCQVIFNYKSLEFIL